MTRKPERAGPQAAGNAPRKTSTTAGRDPATKPKQFRVFGKDTTTGKKVSILSSTDLATGSTATGIDEASGKTVTFKVSGRDPAT